MRMLILVPLPHLTVHVANHWLAGILAAICPIKQTLEKYS